jgi:predicted phage terminase large subunit-like protein
MTEKQKLSKWQKSMQELFAGTTIDTEEPDNVRNERIKQLEADPEAWFCYYFPGYSYAVPAAFHKEATQRILQNPEWYEVRMWSRELAKSTRTMMEVLYLTFVGHTITATSVDEGTTEPIAKRHKKRYVLLISNSLDNATRLLMPYKANLEQNKRLIQDYGKQENSGAWQAAEFTTASGIGFRAIGAGQSPRGSRNEEARPDILLFDDIDTDADCLNGDIVARHWRWIEEAAIGTRSVSQPTTIVFCGNRIATDCCIVRAARLADSVTIVNIRAADGSSTWPEKNTEQHIDRVLAQKSYAAAQKEYYNNPIMEGAVFQKMAYKPVPPLPEYQLLVCYTDPSYKDTNDYKATILVGKWQEEFHVIKCYLEQATTAQMIDWHKQIMKLVGANVCYYYMEEVFMQDVLVREVALSGKQAGVTIPVRGDKRKKPDKFMRIESLLEPLHRNGLLYLSEAERHNPHMQRLDEQFVAFSAGSRAHDDGPDAVEGAVWKINEKLSITSQGSLVAYPRPLNSNRY